MDLSLTLTIYFFQPANHVCTLIMMDSYVRLLAAPKEMDFLCLGVIHSNITQPGFCPQSDSSEAVWMRDTSPKVKVTVLAYLGMEELLVVRKHLHLKFTQHPLRFDWQCMQRQTGRGLEYSQEQSRDGWLGFLTLLIEFIMWPSVTLSLISSGVFVSWGQRRCSQWWTSPLL